MTWEQIALITGAVAVVILCGWLFIGVLKKNEGSDEQ